MSVRELVGTVSHEQADDRTSGSRFYRPELDILRLIAFLCVFAVHVLTLSPGAIPADRIIAPMGAYGMCLFFFLSSYLITELLRRETDATGTIHIRSFYIRRILRIWPLYFAFLLFGKIVGYFFPLFHLENARLLAFVFLLGNWYLARHGINDSPVGPLWSISLEEQFYLVWPALAKFAGIRALLWCSIALLPLAWLTIYLHLGSLPSPLGIEFDGVLWCNTFVQFQYFALGAIMAITLRGRSLRLPGYVRIAGLVLGFGAWFLASYLFSLPQFTDHRFILIGGYALIGLGCITMFAALLGASPKIFPKSLIYLGKVSYGLYVFHILFIEIAYLLLRRFVPALSTSEKSVTHLLLNAILAIIPTIGLSILSYRYFETPFLILKKKFTFIQSRAV
jgi:peptidoglycan/LPS O-acetylase OafA/YrhL